MSNFVIDGVSFNWTYEPDHDMGLPWEEQDGHGLIRDVRSPDKKAGEVIIYSDRGRHWLYDVAGTVKIAAKDGWGLNDDDKVKLQTKLGRAPTKKEITAEAVRQDMDFCRKFLSGDIGWFTVCCWPEEDLDAIEYVGGFLCEHGDLCLEDAAKTIAGDYLVLKESAEKEELAEQAAREAELDLIMTGL